MRRALAAGRVWGLPVLWLWRREPERPQVVVVYVSAAGTVLAGGETGTARQIGAGEGK